MGFDLFYRINVFVVMAPFLGKVFMIVLFEKLDLSDKIYLLPMLRPENHHLYIRKFYSPLK